MPVIYNTAVKTDRMTATRDYFGDGTLEIRTSADAVLATFDLTTAGGTVSGAVWTVAFDASTVTATGTGTAAKAVIKNSGGDAHLTGLTVGTSASDIVLDNTSINSSQSVTLSSATITHAPDPS
jgi:hypothetical protein